MVSRSEKKALLPCKEWYGLKDEGRPREYGMDVWLRDRCIFCRGL